MELGGFGVWTTYRAIGDERAAEAAALAEELGYDAFWLGASPRLPEVRPLLEATRRLLVGTSIVNVWQYDPAQLAAEHAELAASSGRRLLTGIGIGHPEATSDYSKPLTAMRVFLDGMDEASTPIPPEERALAALGPKMLELSAERTLGSLPYFTPVEHTRFARERLGDGKLLAVELACVIDEDEQAAREKAREFASFYLGLSNYTANLRRFGFGEEDLAGGGSDRLL
ncbi:MAG: TIGR03620 family F420-dependent LLM class oxidoreductase, partial [Solirubrobacteraceae bacterium]